MNNSIIHASQERGILICLHQSYSMLPTHIAKLYPLVLIRSGPTRFALASKCDKPHVWVERIILDTFKSIGYPVKPSIRPKQYSIIGKRAKFQFLLKYGSLGDK